MYLRTLMNDKSTQRNSSFIFENRFLGKDQRKKSCYIIQRKLIRTSHFQYYLENRYRMYMEIDTYIDEMGRGFLMRKQWVPEN